jgi:O-antigen/teichoic acid export membrane protein
MLLIPIFLGLAASAAVAAVWTLYRPIGQVMQALGSLVLPAFSRMAVGPGGRSRLKRRAMGIAALFAGVVALYALIVGVFAEPILHFLYRGKYDNHTMLVALFGMVMVSSMLVGVFVSALKAIGRVKETTRVWLISTLATSMLAFPFMRTWGANGALLAFAGSYLLASLLAYKYLRRIG